MSHIPSPINSQVSQSHAWTPGWRAEKAALVETDPSVVALRNMLSSLEESTSALEEREKRSMEKTRQENERLLARIRELEEQFAEREAAMSAQIASAEARAQSAEAQLLGLPAANAAIVARAEAAEAQVVELTATNAALLARAQAAEAKVLELTAGTLTLLNDLKQNIAQRINKISGHNYTENDLLSGINFGQPSSKVRQLNELKSKYNALNQAVASLGQSPNATQISGIFRSLLDSESIQKSHTGIKRWFNVKSKTYQKISKGATVFFSANPQANNNAEVPRVLAIE